MSRHAVLLTWSLCAAAACKGGAKTDDPSPSSTPSVVSPPWPADAPPATGRCAKHSDCVITGIDGPAPPDPCCDARTGYLPMLRRHLEFIDDFRRRRCAGVRCPPLPLPGPEPAPCARVALCRDARCVSACDDPSTRDLTEAPPDEP